MTILHEYYFSRPIGRENLCKPKAMKYSSMAEVPPSFGKLKQIIILKLIFF